MNLHIFDAVRNGTLKPDKLGCYLQCILKKEEVRHVDVVEIDETLLGMMYKYFVTERVTFHHADAFTKKWEKGEKWDVVWHDIWPTICSDNLQEMTALKRKFGRRCKWQGCWGEEYSRYLRPH
jgi:hypothetical protein